MAFFAAEAAVPAAATSLVGLLSLGVERQKACELRIQLVDGAANPLYIGSSSGLTTAANRGAELSAGETFQIGDPAFTKIDLNQIFVIGTVAAANVVLVSIVY